MKVCIISFLALLALLLAGCPDGQPVKPDPCAVKKPVSAKFYIYELVEKAFIYKAEWIYYDTDTIGTSDVLFIADDRTADEYEWHLGAEIINTRSFWRTNFPIRKNIPITLIIRKRPDTTCFPDDDGIDTLTRVFYILGGDTNGCIEKDVRTGSYYGYNTDDITNYFTITITNCFLDTTHKDYPIRTVRIQNLTPGSDISHWARLLGSYREVYFWDPDNFEQLAPEGIFIIRGKNTDSIDIYYSIQKAPGWENHKNRVNKIFKGVRIK